MSYKTDGYIYDPQWEIEKQKEDVDGFSIGGVYYETPLVQYNMYMTILNRFMEMIPDVAETMKYQKEIQIITEYPKDLTEVKFPTICIREVQCDDDPLESTGTIRIKESASSYADINAYRKRFNEYIQIDCVGGTKYDRLILKSIVASVLVRSAKFPLLNYMNDPQGEECVFDEEIAMTGAYTIWHSTDDTLQYIACFRQMFKTYAVIVPWDAEGYVDLNNITMNSYVFEDDKPTAQTVVDNPDDYEEHLSPIIDTGNSDE